MLGMHNRSITQDYQLATSKASEGQHLLRHNIFRVWISILKFQKLHILIYPSMIQFSVVAEHSVNHTRHFSNQNATVLLCNR